MSIKWEDFKFRNSAYVNLTNRVLTDVLCPECGEPLYMRTDKILTSLPAQYQYECKGGWVGYSHNKWQKGLGE